MTSKDRGITAIDLFSGVGGLSRGWLDATLESGGRLLAAVDSDASLEPVFEQNLPGTTFVERTMSWLENGDATQVSRLLGVTRGDIDVLLAGPPCQAVSLAGKRSEGHLDNRLAMRVAEFADFLHPRVIVMENVPEFASAESGRLIGRVRVQLTESGYETQVGVLNASAFGVPQIRQRCFLVAVSQPLLGSHSGQLLPAPQTTPGITARIPIAEGPNGLAKPPSVIDAIGDLPPLDAGGGSEISDYSGPPTSAYALRAREGSARLLNHVAVGHSVEMVAALARLEPGETPQLHETHHLRPKSYFRSAYARLVSNGLAPTITTQTHNPGSGRFTHYSQDRVLTVREAARLQSFPDSFQFLGDNATQRRHVGNAVPPALARAISEHLLRFMRH